MAYFDYPYYPFRRPPELDGARPRHPVAVVGAGPVGVCAALALARFGVPSVVLDSKHSVSEGSRAICISRRSLEILQPLGAAQGFVDKGLGWTRGRSFYRDRVVFHLEMPHSDDERFFPMTNLQQQYIEKFLVERAGEMPEIDLRWQSEVIGLEAGERGARLTVRTPQGCYELAADWVVAADGARSAVRRFLGLELAGEAYEGRYLIADIHMRIDHPTERRAFFDPPANPGSTVLIHRQPDDIWRIDYQLREEDDPQTELAPERVRARIGRILEMIGAHGPWTLEWHSLYKAYTLALDDYRHGRVLFAGDAAHLVPIFGVRGLNSGFADADNLGWKLAFVVRGLACEGLLDSYSPERRAATLDAFANAAKSTRFMTPPTRGHRIMRTAALELALDHELTRALIDPRQSTPYDYLDGPLTTFRERDAAFEAGPRAGAPLVNVRLGADAFLLDRLPAGFAGLLFAGADGGAPWLEGVLEVLRARRIPFGILLVSPVPIAAPAPPVAVVHDAEGRVADRYGARAGSFYLVRPDGHVCARWRAVVPAEVASALAVALGGPAATLSQEAV